MKHLFMLSQQIETDKDYHWKAHEILFKKEQIVKLSKKNFSKKFMTISPFCTDISFKIYSCSSLV